MALLFFLFVTFGCAPVKPKPNNWQKCCVLHTICISDGKGGPNCDATDPKEQQP
jgi:hypothetical protein